MLLHMTALYYLLGMMVHIYRILFSHPTSLDFQIVSSFTFL